ncbi:hypothetical protein [Heliorestis convoluta]|uniref:Uncharacterized protein n=1 Tax=Heliorestis convoluta TaxID=356322 RepID=A0A5Q2N0U7_9FIRM|nr:hypothetical protein [Heliorestis convoluta]QGG48964.1 hypothetical protein FTV88_2875 [Heliorestis convoluta]
MSVQNGDQLPPVDTIRDRVGGRNANVIARLSEFADKGLIVKKSNKWHRSDT